MTVVVYSDLHLGTSPGDRLDELLEHAAGDDVEAVFVLGDVVDDNRDHASSPADGERYEQQGRAFLERLDALRVPVVVVPGNHDPVATMHRLTDGLDRVVCAHERRIEFDDERFDTDTNPLDGGSVVGFGCEQFDLTTGLDSRTFPALDVLPEATTADIHYRAERVAESVERAVGTYLDGALTTDDVADELDIAAANRAEFADRLVEVRETFETLSTLLERASEPTVLLSHQPPFHTELDHHHSDRGLAGRLHRGSIALKMAIAAVGPELVLSGHTHSCGRDEVETARGYTTAYNPGAPGVARVTLDETASSFRIERVDVSFG